MSLLPEIDSFKNKLAELLIELDLLSLKVSDLEKSNQILQDIIQTKLNSDDRKESEQGLKAIRELYRKGFHICHAHFAEARDEECLFCQAIINNGNN